MTQILPALGYFQENEARFLSQLAALVAVPSVSLTGFDQKEVVIPRSQK